MPPSELIKSVSNKFQDKHVTYIQFRGEGKSAIFSHYSEHEQLQAYLNPYNGKVLHVERGPGFFDWVLDLHMNLLLGETGRKIVAYSTLIFVVLLITGILLWWPKNRKAVKIATWFRWKPTTKWKRKNYDLHNVLGFYASFIVIFVSLTGLAFSFEWMNRSIQFLVSGGGEFYPWEYVKGITEDDGESLSKINLIDQAYFTAINDYEGQAKRISIYIPDKKQTALRIGVNPSEKTYYDEKYDYYDQLTGRKIKETGFKERSIGGKVAYMYYDIHIGKILGLPGQLLAFFASLISASLPITGFIIWYGRNKKKRKFKKKGSSGSLKISNTNRSMLKRPVIKVPKET